ncbi:MAG: phosphotransferase family protein [Bacillus sp. (in: firmicutes)]
MQAIQIEEIPEEIKQNVHTIYSIHFPPQGCTSNVAMIKSKKGDFILKRIVGEQFCDWLHKEVIVLRCLAEDTELPVPKVRKFLEQKHQGQSWLLMELLEGETLRVSLMKEKNKERRQEMIYHFGKQLSRIHTTPCPKPLMNKQPWLDRMLAQAAVNLEKYEVDGTITLLKHLKINKPDVPKQTLIHGDYTIDNVLISDGKMTGIIDWSGGVCGDPRYDVALAVRPNRMYLEARKTRSVFSKDMVSQ